MTLIFYAVLQHIQFQFILNELFFSVAIVSCSLDFL